MTDNRGYHLISALARIRHGLKACDTRPLIFTTIIALISASACYIAAGASLNFFIGCVLLSGSICPILVTICEAWAVIWIVTAGSWLIVGHLAGVTVTQWMSISVILGGTLGVQAAATRLLMRWQVTPVLAAAIVMTANLFWLTWPIWLSPSIAGATLNWSISLHPLLAMNGVLKELGIWTEQPIAYNLTTLGQDVQYRLPTSSRPVIVEQLLNISLFLLPRRWYRTNSGFGP